MPTTRINNPSTITITPATKKEPDAPPAEGAGQLPRTLPAFDAPGTGSSGPS